MPAILSENLDMGAFFMREKLKQFYIVLLVFILTIMGQYGHVLQTEAVFSTQKETVSAKSQTGKRLTGQKSEEKVYASGIPIGIYIKTEGILVLGLQQIDGKNSPASCKIKAGDYILKLNAQNITTKQQFIRLLQKNGEKEVVLTLKRKNKKIKVKVQPVYSAKNKCYQIGVWIRNDTQGIGTITFIREDGTFAALGHGINDGDIGVRFLIGIPIGIYIKTEGILVLGLQQIDGKNSPASCKIKAGDYILKLNAQNITTKQQFIRLLQKNGEKEVVLTLKRKNKKIKVKVQPVYSAKNKCYQIGVWIRNDTQGIGTITFIREDGTFAALGHGINDGDIGVRFLIEGGSAYRTNISSILKGKSGMPGEIIGTIDYSPQNYLGEIYANTNGGILGKITENKKEFFTGKKISIAKKSEVKTGKAYLRSSISGKSKDYSIEIEKVLIGKLRFLVTYLISK